MRHFILRTAGAILLLSGLILFSTGFGGSRGNDDNETAWKPPPDPSPTPPLIGFGNPLPGLTADQLTAFNNGIAQLLTDEDISTGLGPIFNGQSCSQCHNQPSGNPLGAGAVTETRFKTSDGRFDLLHQACITQAVQDGVPKDSVLVAHRKSTPIFGAGLIEAIPDAEIIAGVKHGQMGVFGRPAILSDAITNGVAAGSFTTNGGTFTIFNGAPNHVGRFGWKCQQASLIAFARDAEINELGESNIFFPNDIAPFLLGVEPPNQAALDAAEPPGLVSIPTTVTPNTVQDTPNDTTRALSPTNLDDAGRYHDAMQLADKPPTIPLTKSAEKGQRLFNEIGCALCHTPTMTTGPNAIASLNIVTFHPYGDFLLHHMGNLGDGIVQAAAGSDEMRTAPLWGLRARTPFLHDGRAETVQQAIHFHDGEATQIREEFDSLSKSKKNDLLEFLNSI